MTIQVKACSLCPFAHNYYQGVFLEAYCTLGLFTGGDWRKFTVEELAEGMTTEELAEAKKRLGYPSKTPRVIPEWCGLRNGVQLIVGEGNMKTKEEIEKEIEEIEHVLDLYNSAPKIGRHESINTGVVLGVTAALESQIATLKWALEE